MLQIDVHSTVLTTVIILAVIAIISLFFGIKNLSKSKKIPFYAKRHARMVRGWRLVFTALVLIPLALVIFQYSEPVIYQYYVPSPTATQSPTITMTPSITLTPTITQTPSMTDTPSITITPSMPQEIAAEFEALIEPESDAVFSAIQFSNSLNSDLQPVDPSLEFTNPVGHLYGAYSYNNMSDGVQWTALWYWEGELVYYETSIWEGGTGGYGYSDWNPSSDQWQPGVYEVQLFIGEVWMVSGTFTVVGEPPTPTITNTPTQTATPTNTPTKTGTPTNTATRWPTASVTITLTLIPTSTIRPTDTQQPTPTE